MSEHDATDLSKIEISKEMAIEFLIDEFRSAKNKIQHLEAKNKILMEAVKYGYDMACSGEYGFEEFVEAINKCDEVDNEQNKKM